MVEIHIKSNSIHKELFNTIEELLQYVKFKKGDVYYSADEKMLTIKLTRYDLTKKKVFLFFASYRADEENKIESKLIIRDIISCKIRDGEPQKLEVVPAGFVLSKNNSIYIGSRCEEENKYGIAADINSVDIQLIDVG